MNNDDVMILYVAAYYVIHNSMKRSDDEIWDMFENKDTFDK